MERQKLVHITRGLQNAAAETNSLVSQQYIRVMSEYFEKLPDGSLQAKMVRVELDEEHYVMVPLVSLSAPTGLGLDRMRIEMSIKLENAEDEKTQLFSFLRNQTEQADAGMERSQFSVSLSPRGGKEGARQSDHVNIELEFRALETPEAIQRVVETYTNLMQPLKKIKDPGGVAPEPNADAAVADEKVPPESPPAPPPSDLKGETDTSPDGPNIPTT